MAPCTAASATAGPSTDGATTAGASTSALPTPLPRPLPTGDFDVAGPSNMGQAATHWPLPRADKGRQASRVARRPQQHGFRGPLGSRPKNSGPKPIILAVADSTDPSPPNSPAPPPQPSAGLASDRSFWTHVQEEAFLEGLQEVVDHYSPTSPTFSPTTSDDEDAESAVTSSNHFDIGIDEMVEHVTADPAVAFVTALTEDEVEEVAEILAEAHHRPHPLNGEVFIPDVDANLVGEELDAAIRALVLGGELRDYFFLLWST